MVNVGNTKMMDAVGAKWHDCHHVGTIIHVAINGTYAGHIVINDKVKDDSAAAIARKIINGINNTIKNKTPKKDIGTLLQFVKHAYCAIDGIKRLLYGLEVTGEDACQSPVQVG